MVRSFLRRVFRCMPPPPAGRRRAARPKARGRRPELLVLEDRWLPSTVLWNGSAGDGLWRNGANWVGGSAPGPADDAVLDDTSPPVTVTVSAGSPVSVRSLTDTKPFVISASFTVTAGTSSVSGPFTVGPPATLAASGSLTATGTATIDGA